MLALYMWQQYLCHSRWQICLLCDHFVKNISFSSSPDPPVEPPPAESPAPSSRSSPPPPSSLPPSRGLAPRWPPPRMLWPPWRTSTPFPSQIRLKRGLSGRPKLLSDGRNSQLLGILVLWSRCWPRWFSLNFTMGRLSPKCQCYLKMPI